MATKGGEGPQYFEVLEEDLVEMTLILPDGSIKQNYRVRIDATVQEEKERIWNLENIRRPNVDRLVLVLLMNAGKEVVMEDGQNMAYYKENYGFSHSELKFENRSTARNREERSAHPQEDMAVKVKRC